MENQEPRGHARLAASIVLLVLIGASLVGAAYLQTNRSPISATSTSGTASTSESSNVTSSPSTASTNFTAWTVINSNATVYGNLACEDTVAMLYPTSCPPTFPGAKSPSLNVEIISYHGEVLYDANISIGVNGQPITWTMWFTNSTIFCVSPYDGYALCPTHPPYPTIVISTRSASSSNPSNGLRLDLQLSNTTEGINVTVDVYNTLDTVNNVTSASDWAIYSNSLNDICDNQVVAFAVYQGNYGAGNFTAGSPLAIDNVGAGNICPVLSPSVVYSFSPDSGVASAPAGAFAPGPFSKNVTLSYTVSGYSTCGVGTLSFRPQNASGLWLCPQYNSYKFNPFPPGTYTVVALDEWGNVVIQHFQVESFSSQSTTSSQAKTVTECMETITTTFANVTRTQTATEEIACVASSSGLSVSGLSLCPTNCVYPAPYLTGQLNINGTSPLSRIDVYVNGTFDGTPVQNPSTTSPGCISSGNHTTCSTESVVTNTLTRFAYIYKGSIPNEFIPAVVGDRYVVTFVASFADGSSAVASAIVVATA